MARHGSTYRSARRNALRTGKHGGFGLVWPKGGVQLDPMLHKPTKFYCFADNGGTTAKMLKTGKRWFYEMPKKWLRLDKRAKLGLADVVG